MTPLLERILKRTKPEGGCVIWQGYVDYKGYGRVTVNRVNCRAHRIVWSEHNGPIPEDRMICHTCDNRRCVNIDHLYLGTARTNANDTIRRGRTRNGSALVRHENHPNAKITYSAVQEMRRIYSRGNTTQAKLAVRFGISRAQVGRILTGEAWNGERPNT